MPFTWDDDRRKYQREWVAAKRARQRKRASMTLGELLAQGRKLAEAAGQRSGNAAKRADDGAPEHRPRLSAPK